MASVNVVAYNNNNNNGTTRQRNNSPLHNSSNQISWKLSNPLHLFCLDFQWMLLLTHTLRTIIRRRNEKITSCPSIPVRIIDKNTTQFLCHAWNMSQSKNDTTRIHWWNQYHHHNNTKGDQYVDVQRKSISKNISRPHHQEIIKDGRKHGSSDRNIAYNRMDDQCISLDQICLNFKSRRIKIVIYYLGLAKFAKTLVVLIHLTMIERMQRSTSTSLILLLFCVKKNCRGIYDSKCTQYCAKLQFWRLNTSTCLPQIICSKTISVLAEYHVHLFFTFFSMKTPIRTVCITVCGWHTFTDFATIYHWQLIVSHREDNKKLIACSRRWKEKILLERERDAQIQVDILYVSQCVYT